MPKVLSMAMKNWRTCFRWDEKLSEEDAIDLINFILENGRTLYSSHSYDMMGKRNFTTQDIVSILENGKVVEQEFDERTKNWKYKVEGITVDDGRGVVVSAVIDKGTQMIITVF